MKKILLFINLFIATYSFSQNTFISASKTSAYEEFLNVIQSSDGNFIATGYSEDNTCVVKIDKNGQKIWSKIISNNAANNEGFGIINTADGGFAVSGTINYKMGLYKFDAAGNLSWSKEYSQLLTGNASKLVQLPDGGFFLTGGISTDSDFNNTQSYLIRTDENGNFLWAKSFFNAFYSAIYDLKKTSDNNYVFITQNWNSNDANDSTYIVKINSNGNILWAKYYNSSDGYSDGYSIIQTSDGSYIITGYAYSNTDIGFILKIDANGNLKWSKNVSVTSSEYINLYTTVETADGGYVSAGDVTAYTNNLDSNFYYLFKTNINGDLLWTKTIKKTDGDFGSIYSLIKTNDAGYLGAGSIGNIQGNSGASDSSNGAFLKFDANFNSCSPTGTFGSLSTGGSIVDGNVQAHDGSPTVSNSSSVVTTSGDVTNDCNALPLQLLSFTAMLHNESVQLQWQTAQEINTSYFAVERSQNGRIFNSLKQVAAAGNSSKGLTYSTTDESPFAGTSWYRLKMVDKDGQFTYSKTVAISFSTKNSISINPNPVQNQLNLKIESSNPSKATIQIIDFAGKVLNQKDLLIQSGNNVIPFNVAQFTKGIYSIKIIKDNKCENLKWMKN